MANAVTHRATILPQPAEATWTAVKFVDLLFSKAGSTPALITFRTGASASFKHGY
jgi:hypothetical protein